MQRFVLFIGLAIAAIGCNKGAAATSSEAKAPPKSSDPRPAGPDAIAIPAITVSIDPTKVEEGKLAFTKKGCPACHKIGGGKLVGPDLKGVTARRNPQWLARMILHPEIMLQQDQTAKDLLRVHLTPMSNQHVDPEKELPQILSFLKSNE